MTGVTNEGAIIAGRSNAPLTGGWRNRHAIRRDLRTATRSAIVTVSIWLILRMALNIAHQATGA